MDLIKPLLQSCSGEGVIIFTLAVNFVIRLASSSLIMTPENSPSQAFLSHANKLMLSEEGVTTWALCLRWLQASRTAPVNLWTAPGWVAAHFRQRLLCLGFSLTPKKVSITVFFCRASHKQSSSRNKVQFSWAPPKRQVSRLNADAKTQVP